MPVKFGNIAGHSVVCCATGKGQEETASALTQLLERTRARWVFLVGIAGGFPDLGVHRGDLVVAHTIHSFDYGKLTAGRFIRRPELDFNCDRALLSWAEVAIGDGPQDWKQNILVERPSVGTSKAHSDCYVASSDKVVDDPTHQFYALVKAAFPEIHAVEMEGSGAGASIRLAQTERAVGLLMIRGISDEPGIEQSGGTGSRIAWKAYAAAVAAAFTRKLIEVLPAPNLHPQSTTNPDLIIQPSRTGAPPISLAAPPNGDETHNRAKQAYQRTDELAWPSHDVVIKLNVHPKRRNTVCIEVHFTRHFPGYQDTQGMSVEIPTRRAVIAVCMERLFDQWRTYLRNRIGNEYALRKSGEELYRNLLGPFDGDNQDSSEWFEGFRRLCRDRNLRVRILTKNIFIPWDLLFVSGKGFVGQLHCIETGVGGRFTGLRDENRRADLFDFGRLPFVISHQVQSEAYGNHGGLRSFLANYRTADLLCIERNDLVAFRDSIGGSASDQLIYFSFAHSLDENPPHGRGVQFRIGTDSFRAEQLRDWLSNTSLPYRPLLFLNLYGNQEKRHTLRIIEQYHEFHSEFFAAGASAVIGPEVPVDFDRAVTFASMFCERLFKGSSDSTGSRPTVGDCLWATKKRLAEDGDLSGLLYSYYLVRDIAFMNELVPFKQPTGEALHRSGLPEKGLQSHVR